MHLDTTLGPLPLPERGCILPHEHVFVDLRTSDQPGYAEADPEAVVRLMAPEIERARDAGVVAIVEPGGIGVGRRVDILVGRLAGNAVPPGGAHRGLPRAVAAALGARGTRDRPGGVDGT